MCDGRIHNSEEYYKEKYIKEKEYSKRLEARIQELQQAVMDFMEEYEIPACDHVKSLVNHLT